ncbi:MAG: redoxin domain-containing protein [Gemmatimonadaceae bacterium]|nr:redoxin domain-containing protein [Gemmatimonadaceae bacterium]
MNWKRAFYMTAGVGVPVIALLSYGMTRDPRNIPSPLPGREAPVFTRAVFAPGNDTVLRMTVGDSVRLAEQRGHVVIVNFWASWCLACRDEHEALSLVANRYGAKGVRFYGLLYNDFEKNGIKWIEDMGGQAYPALSDPGARAAIDYGLYGVPETFVIDQTGRVAHKYTGPVGVMELSKLLDSLTTANSDAVASPATDVPVTRALPPTGTKP